MFCARCDKPIQPGEPYERVDKMSPSGAGSTDHVHTVLCARLPVRTYQPPSGFSRSRRH